MPSRYAGNLQLEAAKGVRVGDDLTTLDPRRDDRSTGLSSKLSELGKAEILVVEVLVDHTHHAVLAVVADLLCAVVPNGVRGLNHNLEDILSLSLFGGKVEAGEEASAISDRLARGVEAGLGDGVVLGEEVPFNHVSNLGDNVVGIEAEATETGNNRVGNSGQRDGSGRGVADGVGGSCRGGASGEEESRESLDREHFEVASCVF